LNDAKSKDFSKHVAPNMATNIIRTVLTALVGLFLVPYFIDSMGAAVYALLPLATSVTSYVLVVSDEITNAFSRYLVISIHGGDQKEAGKVYATTVLGLAKTVLIAAPLVAVISVASPYVFQIGPSSALSVQLMFLMILSSALMVSFSACFNSIYVAFNRMYVLYTIRIVYIVSQVAMIIGFFLISGPSLEMIGLAYLISGAVFFVLIWASSKRLCPALRLDRSLYSRELLSEIGRIGMWTVLNRMGLLMFIQASLILINLFIGAEVEAGFAIVAALISMTSTACFTITVVVAPFLYLNYANGNKDNLIRISKMTIRLVGLLIAFPVAYLCVFSPQILTVWVGEDYTHLSGIITVMLSAQLAVCMVSVLETIPVLFLRIRSVALVTLSVGALNIIIAAAVLAFTDFDTMGVAIVWTAAMLVLNVLFYPAVISKMTSSGRTTFLRPMVPGYAALAICAVLGYAATRLFTLPCTWTAVLAVFFPTYAVYLVAVLAVGLNRNDKDTIRSVIPMSIAKFIPRWLL